MATPPANPVRGWLERVGQNTVSSLEEFGYGASLLLESIAWILVGRRRHQPVRVPAVFVQMMETGIYAIPIVTVLAATIGLMLAIQGIHTLKQFGAESQVTVGIALSMVREFCTADHRDSGRGTLGLGLGRAPGHDEHQPGNRRAPGDGDQPGALLGRSRARGHDHHRAGAHRLVHDGWAILGRALCDRRTGFQHASLRQPLIDALSVDDLMHGLRKSAIFAVLITLVGVVNGVNVKGGAEGVGRSTTRSVVQAITAIVITDMLFVFVVTR